MNRGEIKAEPGDGWVIDMEQLCTMLDELRIDALEVRTVEMVTADGSDFCGGYFAETDPAGDYVHVCLLQRSLDTQAAGETLYHELIHAWQSEHLFTGDSDELAREADGPSSYLEEIARAAEGWHATMPIVIGCE